MTVSAELAWGHSPNDDGTGAAESLVDHVRRVQDLAAGFAKPLSLTESASAIAGLHDLGKYAPEFQDYLRKRRPRAGDHWTAGAAAILREAPHSRATAAAALAVAGHHTGLDVLSPPGELLAGLEAVLADGGAAVCRDVDAYLRRHAAHGLTTPQLPSDTAGETPRPADEMLDVRMLFSALVDADYLAKEGHFAGAGETPYRPRSSGPTLDFGVAAAAVDAHVAGLPRGKGPMAAVRGELFSACKAAATDPTGCFTLAAPTGAGKTLAMLAFAMRHAERHGLRRVVLVMPFLSIVEQAAGVVREVLGGMPGFEPAMVLEDHSLADAAAGLAAADPDDLRDAAWVERRKLLAENWDAPVVLTSSVKCLESLHAARPSACRKLHRLGRSVVLFDEVQTLPPRLAVLTLATLSRLAGRFGSTVVFATATQPAFERLDPDPDVEEVKEDATTVGDWADAGWRPRPMVADAAGLFAKAAGRVRVRWTHEEPRPLAAVADEIATSDGSALSIVNLKAHAAALFRAVKEQDEAARHLSTSMCAAHRLRVLADVRAGLKEGEPVRLISTQAVEWASIYP